MDEEKKKKLNDAIAVLRDMCNKHQCGRCPFYNMNCKGTGRFCDFPGAWQDIE